KKYAKEILTLKKSLEEANEQIATLEANIQDSTALRQALDETIALLEMEKMLNFTRLNDLESAFNMLENSKSTQLQLENELSTAVEQLETHKFYLNQAISENDNLFSMLDVVQVQAEGLKNQLDDANKNMIAMKKDFDHRMALSIQKLEDNLKKDLLTKQ